MHLHGFNMYVLHEGLGDWDGTIINEHNPQRRDVVQIRGRGHLVIQFDAKSNPGMSSPDSASKFPLAMVAFAHTQPQVSGRSTVTSRGMSRQDFSHSFSPIRIRLKSYVYQTWWQRRAGNGDTGLCPISRHRLTAGCERDTLWLSVVVPSWKLEPVYTRKASSSGRYRSPMMHVPA